MARDLMGDVVCSQLFSALARTTTANGSSIDLGDSTHKHSREQVYYLDVGAVSGTSPTLDVKIQDSDDDSTFADVSGATFTQATAATTEEISGKNLKRYVRAVATIAGTTPDFTFSVAAVCGKSQSQPV